MNVKKAIKRIAALAAGTTMVTATIMGAMAYDLGDYPAPFVEDGVFGGKLVIGQTAKVTDVIGAIDIAASLQAAAKSPISVDGTETISVEGGVQIKSSSEDFNFGDSVVDFNNGEYDSDDFESLLADGTLEDDDGTETDYELTIDVPDAAIDFGQNDDYSDDPVFYIDLATGSPTLTFNVEFDDTISLLDFTESQAIEMFGKAYTIDPNHALGDDITLYGSDLTVVVSQNEPVTVELNGDDYTLEVLGGNSDDSSAIIRVTGDGTETKTLEAGDSKKMAGLDVYIDDVFISNIGEDTISVSIFVGSEKLVIPFEAVGNVASYEEVTVGTEDNTDIYAWFETSGATDDLDDIDAIHFQMTPSDFDDPSLDNDEWNWLPMGSEYTDALFGFSIAFEGMSPSMASRDVTSLERNGDSYHLVFTNMDGDDYDFELVYAVDDTTVGLGDDGDFQGIIAAGANLEEDWFFVLESDDATPTDRTSYIFEVRDINDDDEEVTLRELGSGNSKVYQLNDEIADTGVSIDFVGVGVFNLTAATLDYVITADGMMVDWTLAALGADFTVVFTEDAEDADETTADDTLTVVIDGDADDDIDMTSAAWAAGTDALDTDSNVRYGVSDYGTWFEQEEDNNGDYLHVYYSGEETDFNVFLNGPNAVVKTSGTSSGTAYTVNNFVVGQIAVYDNEAAGLLGKTPLIVVGGPCVNTVAMTLMGNPEVCWEGFTEGKAKIAFFAAQNAVLVAGYSGEDTTGAAQVLAAYDDHALSGTEVEVITTDLTNLEVNVVA